jgi:hypothetical protein
VLSTIGVAFASALNWLRSVSLRTLRFSDAGSGLLPKTLSALAIDGFCDACCAAWSLVSKLTDITRGSCLSRLSKFVIAARDALSDR